MENELLSLSSQVGDILTEGYLTIAAAESCTGGLLSHILTGVSGSSAYFIGGVVAYSNRIKETVLGVSIDTLEKFGAVSAQTAQEMAQGIAEKFHTAIGLSTTGIAGPTGGTPEKPIGLVWIGIHFKGKTYAHECHFDGDREAVKTKTVNEILIRLLVLLKS
mgnify:CR=1 FL=1